MAACTRLTVIPTASTPAWRFIHSTDAPTPHPRSATSGRPGVTNRPWLASTPRMMWWTSFTESAAVRTRGPRSDRCRAPVNAVAPPRRKRGVFRS